MGKNALSQNLMDKQKAADQLKKRERERGAAAAGRGETISDVAARIGG